MKKLMTLMLGLALSVGCVSTTFAQDAPKKTKKAKKGKKSKKSQSKNKM